MKAMLLFARWRRAVHIGALYALPCVAILLGFKLQAAAQCSPTCITPNSPNNFITRWNTGSFGNVMMAGTGTGYNY
ncbi:MAG: hypothetical protein N2110_10325, partial [Flavobacteriales bacterium]|nr:hypothetical protein [Flavobacteriales bacterium]